MYVGLSIEIGFHYNHQQLLHYSIIGYHADSNMSINRCVCSSADNSCSSYDCMQILNCDCVLYTHIILPIVISCAANYLRTI